MQLILALVSSFVDLSATKTATYRPRRAHFVVPDSPLQAPLWTAGGEGLQLLHGSQEAKKKTYSKDPKMYNITIL